MSSKVELKTEGTRWRLAKKLLGGIWGGGVWGGEASLGTGSLSRRCQAYASVKRHEVTIPSYYMIGTILSH